MKIAVTSDLHGYIPAVPAEAELLLICGDISPLELQRKPGEMEEWLKTVFIPKFHERYGGQIIMVPGNHDLFFEQYPDKVKELFKGTEIICLFNETIIWNNIKIFGTPYCKPFGPWAFMKPLEALGFYYHDLQKDTDIMISHDSPTLGGLGMINEGWKVGTDAGNPELSRIIELKKPRYFFSGHIHSGNHEFQKVGDTMMANTSIVNEAYSPINDILIFDYQEGK
jgi:Icc-related predicted phosphoesterase